MKVRATAAQAGFTARLTAVRWGAIAMLASAAVAACTTSSPSVTLPSSSPARSSSATPTARPSRATSTATPSASPSTRPPASESASPSPSATPRHSASPFPTVAPATGGGGTAGSHDTLLLGLGAAAMLAGAVSIVYRRKVLRNR